MGYDLSAWEVEAALDGVELDESYFAREPDGYRVGVGRGAGGCACASGRAAPDRDCASAGQAFWATQALALRPMVTRTFWGATLIFGTGVSFARSVSMGRFEVVGIPA